MKAMDAVSKRSEQCMKSAGKHLARVADRAHEAYMADRDLDISCAPDLAGLLSMATTSLSNYILHDIGRDHAVDGLRALADKLEKNGS